MTFEAVVIDVIKATYTVKNVVNGRVYHNCRLCAMGSADWAISKDDYVLCMQSEAGQVYVIGEIKGREPSTDGFRLGESDTDKFVVTQEATLIHVRDINTTIIDPDGLDGFYKKVTVKGFGTVIECTEDQISIGVPGSIDQGSKIVITPSGITLFGEASGGILKGNETQEQIDKLGDKLNDFIKLYLEHGHEYPNPAGGLPPQLVTSKPGDVTISATTFAAPPHTTLTIPDIQNQSLQSTKVKSS